MRPCRNCRAPIENAAAVCPTCAAAQGDRAQPTGPVPTPVLRRRFFGRKPPVPAATNAPPPERRRRGFVAAVLSDVFGLLLGPESLVVLLCLLVLGAVVGGALAGMGGAVAGAGAAFATIVLFFAFLRVIGSSEG